MFDVTEKHLTNAMINVNYMIHLNYSAIDSFTFGKYLKGYFVDILPPLYHINGGSMCE